MPEMIADQRSELWLSTRLGKITASTAAACLRLDPWQSPQKAWRSILGTEPKNDNKHMAWGTEFEPMARQAYECETGSLVTETGFWVHPVHAWLGASPDGLVGEDGLVEIKCPGKLPEKVPVHHRIQMMVQMIVTGRKWCDYFVWTHDAVFCRRVVLTGWNGMVNKLERFYREFVMTNTEPPRKKRRKK